MEKEQEQSPTEDMENDDTKSQTFKDLEPYRQLRVIINRFLADLECTKEMFEIVTSTLRQKDRVREDKIDEIVNSIKKLEKHKEDDSDENSQASANEKTLRKKARRLYYTVKNLYNALRKLKRADTIFHQNSIIILVSRYDKFLSEVYSHRLYRHPEILENSEISLSYDEILQIGSIEEVKERLIGNKVDSWLRRTHIEKLDFFDKEMKLDLKKHITCRETLIELTQRRHVLAHTGGRVTSQYIKVCGDNNVAVEFEEGEALEVDETYFEEAYQCLFEIGVKIGQSVWRNLYPDKLEAADSALQDTGYDLLLSEQWNLARTVFDYALKISEGDSSDKSRRIYLINKCIALKQSGREKEMLSLLDSADWSATHPKFILAVHVLKEEYKQAENVMTSMNGQDPPMHSFINWPLFRDFRETESFRKAFKELYGEEYEIAAAKELAALT